MQARLLFAIGALALVTGCASGMKHSEMRASMPELKADEGRIYFYRRASMMGAAIQPEIRLNGAAVGTSIPGGFFFLNRPAGNYEANSTTEVDRKLTFTLAKGETKYIRTYTSFGVAVGRINFELVSPADAAAEVDSLSYTGAPK